MELSIRGGNMEIDDRLRRHVQRRIDGLHRQLPAMSRATVSLVSESNRVKRPRFSAKVTLTLGPSILPVEQRAIDPRTALDWAVEILSYQVAVYKTRAYRQERARHHTLFAGARHVFRPGQSCCLLFWCRPKRWDKAKLWFSRWGWPVTLRPRDDAPRSRVAQSSV